MHHRIPTHIRVMNYSAVHGRFLLLEKKRDWTVILAQEEQMLSLATLVGGSEAWRLAPVMSVLMVLALISAFSA